MSINELLVQQNMSKYRLAKLSGLPQTTVIDICNGKTSLLKCTAETLYRIAKTLNVSMESLLETAFNTVRSKEGNTSIQKNNSHLPQDNSYLECGLPPFLKESIQKMQAAWDKLDRGEKYSLWDCDFCTLQSDINNAEVNGVISSEQAWYLRNKYLRMERSDTVD